MDKLVNKGDVVLEIGPHLGEATRRYVDKAHLVVLVDKSDQAEKGLKDLLDVDKVKFVKGDVRSFDTIEQVRKIIDRCDFFSVDMGGGRYPDTVFKVWATWSGVFEPKRSLIRNRGLAEFIQRTKIDDESVKGVFPDNGWLSEYGRGMPYKMKKQLGPGK